MCVLVRQNSASGLDFLVRKINGVDDGNSKWGPRGPYFSLSSSDGVGLVS